MVFRDFKDYILTANKKRIEQLKAFIMTTLKETCNILGNNNLNKLWYLKNNFAIRRGCLKIPSNFLKSSVS